MRKISIFLLLLGLSKISYAISFLNNSEESSTSLSKGLNKETNGSHKKDSVSRKSHPRKKLSSAEFENELSRRNEVYDSQLSKKMDAFYSGPIVIENFHKIRTLDSYNGILRDSLVLTQSPSEVVIYADEKGGLLSDSKLRCKGGVFIQRVKIYCDLLVTPDKEFPIKVLIREKVDGSSTLVPDKFYTGEEARFIKQSFSSFFGGVMDASKDRSMTVNGEQELVNAKNKVYAGMFAIADNSESELKKEADDVQVAAVVNSGREVRIEFLEGVKNE